MAIVFTPCAGAVAIVREGCDETDHMLVTIGDNFNSIITSLSLELSGNYQFLHTLNDFIYVYSFGDRIGVLNVSGVGFTNSCGGSGDKGAIMGAYEYYKKERIAVSERALKIVLEDSKAKGTFLGFLTGMRVDVTADTPVGPLGYWSMRFELLPEE
jgi:hypothetical protein